LNFHQRIKIPLPVSDVDHATVQFLERRAAFYLKQLEFMCSDQRDKKQASQLAQTLGLTGIVKLVTFPKIEYVLQNEQKKINAHHAMVKSKVLNSLHD